jgi:hypothetical protein
MKTFNTNTLTNILFTGLISVAGITTVSAQEYSRSSSNNTTPVLLMSFDAETSDNDHGELTWAMENQTNCKWFVIERSGTASGFDSIGVVAGTNNTHYTNYSFTDKNMLSGNNYYRLRQVDMDGVSKYSKVISLYNANKSAASKKAIQLYPNPAASIVNYTLNSAASDRATVQVYNMAGVLVLTQQQDLYAGANQRTVAISTLKNGNYFLKVSSANGAQYEQTFVKML